MKPANHVPLCILAAFCISVVAGCGGYGEVSPTAYEYAKAVYSIANRKATDTLDTTAEQIDAARQRGELSDREARWLAAMIDDAKEGDWEAAGQKARRMMEDQVE
jgi:hypothetical protein